MASFIVEGNHRLSGEITSQGAKNEALQVICATLLTTQEVVIENIPDILDVNNLIKLLGDMGVTIEKKGESTYSFKAQHIDRDFIESPTFMEQCNKLRGSAADNRTPIDQNGQDVLRHPGRRQDWATQA